MIGVADASRCEAISARVLCWLVIWLLRLRQECQVQQSGSGGVDQGGRESEADFLL
jgi:hypothetical protein